VYVYNNIPLVPVTNCGQASGGVNYLRRRRRILTAYGNNTRRHLNVAASRTGISYALRRCRDYRNKCRAGIDDDRRRRRRD
jgi:hypothetical protein